MSLTALSAPASVPAAFPPSPADFWQPLVTFGHLNLGGYEITLAITRPMVVVVISTLLLTWWLLATTRKAAVVPGKGQWLTEQVYHAIRGGVAEDSIGSKDFMRFVPLLFSLFVFILLNNWMGIIPPVQMPPMARIGFPIALTLIVYCVYHWVGIKKNGGFGAYIKWMIPPGVPGWLMPLIVPLELITFFITRPLTLSLRLFGNMFAGHMLLVVFILGGWELFNQDAIGLKFVALPAWFMAVVMTAFEALIQFLQAYVFVLLAASYIGGALADDH